MPLTVTSVKAARPRARPYKLADEKGLYLLVQPTGGKLWRFKYRFNGKEKKLSLGTCPDTGLKNARERRDAARELLEAGTDPSAQRLQVKLAGVLSAANTFQVVAEEYIAQKEREGLSEVTLSKSRWLLGLLGSAFCARPIAAITAQELLAAIRPIEKQGNLETARRMRSFAGRVFKYGIATSRAERDLSLDIRGALTAPKVTHRAAVLDPASVGTLLRAIEDYSGQPTTRFGLQLAPHVFVRPGELRNAEWSEFDLDKAVWAIPARKTKMGKEHHVPLSRQSVAILAAAKTLTGTSPYVFPSASSSRKPISENTLNAALRRMGFAQDQMTAHGFRAMASTLLNESGKWNPDAIERALGHGQVNGVRAAYHRGAYWEERVRMAQWWSDYLDTRRAGAEIVRLRR